MYNYKYVEQELNIEFTPVFARLKNLEATTADLGDFHDLCVALFLLSPMYFDHIGGLTGKGLLGEFRNQLQLRKDVMKSEIIHSFEPVRQQIEKEKSLTENYELL